MAFEREWNCIFCSGCEEGDYLGLLPMERNVPAVADLAVNDGRSETCPWKRYGLDFWIFKGEMGEDVHFFFWNTVEQRTDFYLLQPVFINCPCNST